MTLVINDDQAVEGILGGIGWLIAMYEVKNMVLKESNPVTTGIFTWTILWYIRKVGMNLYKDFKKRNGWEDDQLRLVTSSNIPIWIFLILLTLFIFIGMTNHWTFNQKDLLLTGGIGFVFFLMYIT